MKEITKVVRCEDCRFSIFVPHDIFTGKPRFDCGKRYMMTDEINGGTLASSITFGGCELGERRKI